MNAYLLNLDPHLIKIEPKELTQQPTLKELQAIVGGWIERVPFFDKICVGGDWHPCVAFCNEESKLQGLARNHAATEMWRLSLHHTRQHGLGSDYLAGSIAIVYGPQAFIDEL